MTDLFDRLVASGEAGLQALVDQQQQEHVQLDFKAKSDPSHGAPNDDDKRLLGKALSGFSNSAGGLLIWGVDARKGSDGVDCAQGLLPITDIGRFSSTITTLVGQLLMPRHEGVRVHTINSANSPSQGYLLVWVDRSERRPHRSEAKSKGYFKRVGDSFFEMEHYDIEDAFNRVHVPVLSLAWRVDPAIYYGNNREGGLDANVTIQLRNESFRTAKFPYLYVSKPTGAVLNANGPPLQGFRTSSEGDWRYYVGGSDHVINPETKSSIATMQLQIRPSNTATGLTINNVYWTDFRIFARCRFGCEDGRLREDELLLTGDDVLSRLREQGAI